MTTTTDAERADILQTLQTHRFFLRNTLRDLTDAQAGLRPTVSALCLGGLVKHVAQTEAGWAAFVVDGTAALEATETSFAEREAAFGWGPGDTVAGALADYEAVAARTDALVLSLPSLDVAHPLPSAPWFRPGETRSARRVFLHVVAETAQHAGHADILREALDGALSMG